ncbi:hypothetical protein [Bacillus cereus]|uniref:hypothetical protein n=1 Tax=Bacillus cereus TaxID=1396 RepID=UPI000BF29403|nr:hypothetical protein [Bacillus cereus]PFO78866.1 hypothetical protein COJ77_20920 [Bacillus cereus]
MSKINNVGKYQNDKIGIEEFNEERQAKYTVSIEEAHKLLLQAGITKSKNDQVTMRWARDGEFDALLIGRGRVETRKWLINRESLMNFIAYKNQTFFEYLEMKEELERLRAFKINVETPVVEEKKEVAKKDTPQNKTSRKAPAKPKATPQNKETVATKVTEKK